MSLLRPSQHASWRSTPSLHNPARPWRVPRPRTERDALIAATALVHSLKVVTRNTADFKATGVALINSWEVSDAG